MLCLLWIAPPWSALTIHRKHRIRISLISSAADRVGRHSADSARGLPAREILEVLLCLLCVLWIDALPSVDRASAVSTNPSTGNTEITEERITLRAGGPEPWDVKARARPVVFRALEILVVLLRLLCVLWIGALRLLWLAPPLVSRRVVQYPARATQSSRATLVSFPMRACS
jgi:hypothetical protein